MMDPITVENVSKSYGQTAALDGVTLTFEPGSVHALLGPNGSGKTTLFRVLLGLTKPDGGAVSVPDAALGCGFQEPQFFADLTVGENLSLFGSLTDADDEWVETLVERCGLDRVRHRLVGEVSAGFTKRLDIALALIDRPSVLLLDEPFADIDDEYRPRIRDLLTEYLDDDRVCLVTTHQFDVVAEMLDTVTVLADGQLHDRTDMETLGADGDAVATYYREALGLDD